MTLRLCITCGENPVANAEGECSTCRPQRVPTQIPDDPAPFLPEEECLECGHSAAAHEAHPDGWCNAPDCFCEKFDDGSGYEEPRRDTPVREFLITDKDYPERYRP